eukprot:6212625-Pleurochrysis_carterae.AAC.3
MESILNTIDNSAARIPYRSRCNMSGRELIRILMAKANTASSTVAAAIEAMMRSLEIKGVSEPTLRAFNDFHQQFDRLNRSLPATNRLADSLVADKLANAVRAVGESTRTLLDVKLTILSGFGDLALTLRAIRDVLGDYEARELRKQVELDKGGRAFLATAQDKNKKNDRGAYHRTLKEDPARHAKPKASSWNERHARCRYCDGPHWNRECPTRKNEPAKKDTATEAKQGTAALAVVDPAHTEDAKFNDAVASLLDGEDNGITTLEFATNNQGVALCVRASQSQTKDAPVVTIKDLIAAGIAHSPHPVAVPPLTPMGLERQDEERLFLNQASEREREARRRFLDPDHDPRTSESEDESMRPLEPYVKIWPDSDDSDPDDWRNRVVMNNVRYNRRRANRRMRQLAKERAQKYDGDELIATERDAPATPPVTRSKDSESETSTPATQPSLADQSSADDHEVIKRRAASPLPPIPAERRSIWPLASLAMNIAMIAVAIVLAAQHATRGTGSPQPLLKCDNYECLAEKLANVNMNGPLPKQLYAFVECGAACTVLTAVATLIQFALCPLWTLALGVTSHLSRAGAQADSVPKPYCEKTYATHLRRQLSLSAARADALDSFVASFLRLRWLTT